MGDTRSISFVKGRGSIRHNNRDFVAENVDRSRIKKNITYTRIPLIDAYSQVFNKSVKIYNENQKRKDRQIRSYIEHIQKSKNGEKVFYENVVQIGNKFDCAIGSENARTAEIILDKYMKDFQQRNPNLFVFNAVLHMDEATPHLHIDYFPVARGYKKGLQTRNSLDRALKQQGIGVSGSINKFNNRTKVWQEREKSKLEEIMLVYGWKREPEKGLHREKMTVEQYKAVVELTENQIKTLPKQLETQKQLLHKGKLTVNESDLEGMEQLIANLTIQNQSVKQIIETYEADKKEDRQEIHDLELELSFSSIQINQLKQEVQKAKQQTEIAVKNKQVEINELMERFNFIVQQLPERTQEQIVEAWNNFDRPSEPEKEPEHEGSEHEYYYDDDLEL